jgi:hypothetical protein
MLSAVIRITSYNLPLFPTFASSGGSSIVAIGLHILDGALAGDPPGPPGYAEGGE